MFKAPMILALAGVTLMTACVDPNNYADDPTARQRNGMVVGALTGAALVGGTANDNKLEKALLGGIVGGIAGSAIGYSLDQQAAELRGQLSNGITITNHGDYLVVNMPEGLLFATNSATVNSNQTADLYKVAQSLNKYPQSTVEVVGHTDNTGSLALNRDLSQRRAQSVASILANAGVSSNRIAAYGRAYEQPIASNDTAAGRAQNRRVEIYIRPTK